MSIRPFVWLAALVAVMGLAGTAQAEHFDPFIEPGYFGQPDFQYFAPAEVGDFGGEEPPNTGIYFDYDRTYVNVTRPEGLASLDSGFDGDFTWGNRWEIGFMTEEHSGWQAVLWHLSGPNEYVENFQERLTRFNEDDDPRRPGSDHSGSQSAFLHSSRQPECRLVVVLRIEQDLASQAIPQWSCPRTAGWVPLHEFPQLLSARQLRAL